MRAIDLLLSEILPEDVQEGLEQMRFDKKDLGELMARVARQHPDKYREISKKLTDIGLGNSYWMGDTLTLDDLRPVIDKKRYYERMDAELESAKAVTPDKEWPKVREEIWTRYLKAMSDETKSRIMESDNRLGHSVLSGARGNLTQLSAMVSTPGLYTDYKGRIVPYFIRESYSEGVRPAAKLAGSFGARSSIISTKSATAEAGYIGKMLMQAGADLVVTEDDCGTTNGVLLDPKEDEMNGAVLLQEVDGLKPGTMIDKKTDKVLRKHKGGVLVRSPITCNSSEGVCSKCLGRVPTQSGWAPIGYSAGLTATHAASAPLAQGSLNAKHTAGAYTGGKRQYSGAKFLTQMLNSPETFEDRTALSEVNGRVDRVEEAPQGGNYIYVTDPKGQNETRHYAPTGLKVLVEPGQEVERGDPLSDGLTDVKDMVRLRGLGEGRLHFAKRVGQLLEDSGIKMTRRNMETLARSAVNHVQVKDPDGLGGFLPDEIVSYNALIKSLPPRKNTKTVPVEHAGGKFLQTPHLHYTIGTELLPSMVKKLKAAGIKEVAVADEPFDFEPVMVGLQRSSKNQKDWLARQSTSYLQSNLQEDATAGRDTNVLTNTHYAPTLAYGKDFGKNVDRTGKF